MKLLKNTIIYSVLGYLDQALAFLLLPLYTSYLDPSDYGIIAIVTSVNQFLLIFFSFGSNMLIARQYHGEERKLGLLPMAWGTNLAFQTLLSVILALLIALGNSWVLEPFAKGVTF